MKPQDLLLLAKVGVLDPNIISDEDKASVRQYMVDSGYKPPAQNVPLASNAADFRRLEEESKTGSLANFRISEDLEAQRRKEETALADQWDLEHKHLSPDAPMSVRARELVPFLDNPEKGKYMVPDANNPYTVSGQRVMQQVYGTDPHLPTWMNRMNQTAGEIITMQDNPIKVSTGSNAGDVLSDLAGNVMGFAANPGSGLNAGAGIWKLGEQATGALTSKFAPRLPGLAKETAKVVGATIPFEAARAIGNDRSINPAEMGEAAGVNALLGALTHGVARLGRGAKVEPGKAHNAIDDLFGEDTGDFGFDIQANLEPFKPNPVSPLQRSQITWNLPAKQLSKIDNVEVKNPYGPTPSRAVDMSRMPGEYPVPNLQGALPMLDRAKQANRLALPAGKDPIALPRPGEVVNWDFGNGNLYNQLALPEGKGIPKRISGEVPSSEVIPMPGKTPLYVDPYGVTRKEAGMSASLPAGRPQDPALKLGAKKGELKYPSQEIIAKEQQTVIDRLNRVIQAADANIARAKSGGSGITPTADLMTSYVVKGAAHMAKGVVKQAEWAAAMVKELGEDIKPYLGQIWHRAQELNSTGQTVLKFNGREVPVKVAEFAEVKGVKAAAEGAIPEKNNVKALHKAGEIKGLNHDDLHNMAVDKFGVDSLTKLDAGQFQSLMADVKGLPIDLLRKNINAIEKKQSEKIIKDINKRTKTLYNSIDAINESKKYTPGEKAEMVAELEGKIKQIEAEPTYTKEGRAEVFADTKGELEKQAGWKDRWMPGMNRETPERVFEMVTGKDAKEMIGKYITPIRNGETESVIFKNQERNAVREFGIKSKKESALTQKFAEGLITEQEVRGSMPQKADNIIGLAKHMRSKYDELLDRMNEVLVRNGYDPIPKRKDYMPHMREIGGIIDELGLPTHIDDLPTDINGITVDFKPGKTWFAHALERKGEKTEYDALRGFDRYLEGAANIIYHTDNIKRLRALEDSIRKVNAGSSHLSNFVSWLRMYTDKFAGKKPLMDRGAEGYVGRKIFSITDWARRTIGKNLVNMNLATAIVQTIPLTQSLATSSKPAFVKALKDTMKNVAVNDGLVNQSKFLTRRIGSDPLAMTLVERGTDKAALPLKLVDGFVSQVVVRSKYNEGIKKGLSPEAAMKSADEWAARMMGDRSKGAMPMFFESKTIGPWLQFQLEVNNQVSFMLRDIPNNYTKLGAASAITQLLVYGFLANELYEKTIGYRPAFDLIGIAKNAYEDFNNHNMKKGQAGLNLAQNIVDQLPFASLYSGGRIPLEGAIPNPFAVLQGKSTLGKEAMKPVWNLLSPIGGGNQVRKIVQGAQVIDDKGLKSSSGKYVYKYNPSKENNLQTIIFGPNSSEAAKKRWREGK